MGHARILHNSGERTRSSQSYVHSDVKVLLLSIIFPFHEPKLGYAGAITSCCNSSLLWVMLFPWALGFIAAPIAAAEILFGAAQSETTSPISPRRNRRRPEGGFVSLPNKQHLEIRPLIGRTPLLFSLALKKFTGMQESMRFIRCARDFVKETHAHTDQAL